MPAAALNTFHNVLLKSVAGDNAMSITVNNHPLPKSIASLQVYIRIRIRLIYSMHGAYIISNILDNQHSLRPYWFWYQCTCCIWL